MIFKRSIQRYGRTPVPETPYQRAGQLWDDRIGSARVQARNWRLVAFGALALSGAVSAGLIWQSLQSKVTPYIVEVDRLGEARAVGAVQADFAPTDPQIAWHLASFVRNVRTISLDPVLMRRDWLAAYDFVTPRGARFLSEYAREAKPFERLGERTVTIQITSVVRASDRSFQVKWLETAFERGSESGTSRWTAILTIRTQSPRSAEALRRNPLGIFIEAIDWSRELEPVPTSIRPLSPEVVPSDAGPETALEPPIPDIPSSSMELPR